MFDLEIKLKGSRKKLLFVYIDILIIIIRLLSFMILYIVLRFE